MPRQQLQFQDEYCAEYENLFKEVRNYECFKYLHLGMISPITRKSLPEIAKVVSIKSVQSLHHFIAYSDWFLNELKNGFRQCKQELGWTDYRFTSFKDIEIGGQLSFLFIQWSV